MKKENRKLAQQQRAIEREKAAKRAKATETAKTIFPIVGVTVIVIVLVWAIATSGRSEEAIASEAIPSASDSYPATGDEEDTSLNTTEGLIVSDGDTVDIDYTGYIDGTPFDGGSTDGAGTELVIGSHTYIDGFEEGIIGHAVGETFDLNLKFPDDYWNSEMAGKDVVFTTTINGIYQ